MKKHMIFLILLLSLVLVGCSNDDSADPSDKNSDSGVEDTNDDDNGSDNETSNSNNNFVFVNNNVSIAIDAVASNVLDELGEPMDYFEAPSCAYQGLDKTYYYTGFEVTTYTDEEEVDHIANVVLVDDTVETKEGIYIGASMEDVVSAYGDDYKESTNQYTYIQGDSELQFIFKEGLVASILYTKIL